MSGDRGALACPNLQVVQKRLVHSGAAVLRPWALTVCWECSAHDRNTDRP